MSYGGDTDRGPFLNVINWVFNAIALGTQLCASDHTHETRS